MICMIPFDLPAVVVATSRLPGVSHHLSAHLTTSLAATKLPLDAEAVVPIQSDLVLVHASQIQTVDGLACLLSRLKLNKAEAAWLLGLAVQAHVQVLDGAAALEQFHQLALLREREQVAHVERRGRGEASRIVDLAET